MMAIRFCFSDKKCSSLNIFSSDELRTNIFPVFEFLFKNKSIMNEFVYFPENIITNR